KMPQLSLFAKASAVEPGRATASGLAPQLKLSALSITGGLSSSNDNLAKMPSFIGKASDHHFAIAMFSVGQDVIGVAFAEEANDREIDFFEFVSCFELSHLGYISLIAFTEQVSINDSLDLVIFTDLVAFETVVAQSDFSLQAIIELLINESLF